MNTLGHFATGIDGRAVVSEQEIAAVDPAVGEQSLPSRIRPSSARV